LISNGTEVCYKEVDIEASSLHPQHQYTKRYDTMSAVSPTVHPTVVATSVILNLMLELVALMEKFTTQLFMLNQSQSTFWSTPPAPG